MIKEKKVVTLYTKHGTILCHTICQTKVIDWEYTLRNGGLASVYCPTCKINLYEFPIYYKEVYSVIYVLPI